MTFILSFSKSTVSEKLPEILGSKCSEPLASSASVLPPQNCMGFPPASSMAVFPASVIRSAQDSLSPNSSLIGFSKSNALSSAALTGQSFCGEKRNRAPLQQEQR